jgi:hypothetical protein
MSTSKGGSDHSEQVLKTKVEASTSQNKYWFYQPKMRKIVKALLPTVILLWGFEVSIRLLLPQVSPELYNKLLRFYLSSAEVEDQSLVYEAHPYLAYVQTSDDGTVNADGFNFPDHPREKPNNTLRIAALGGSTTAGPTAWPFQLEQILNQQHVEVLNFGTPGWTSAESAVNYILNVQDYSPDLVIVHHAANDIGPLSYPNFHPDYRHYRKVLQLSSSEQEQLRLSQGLSYTVDTWLGGHSFIYIFLRSQFIGLDRPQFDLQHLTVHSIENTKSTAVPMQEEGEHIQTFLRNLKSITTIANTHGAQMLFVSIPYVQSTTAQLLPGWNQRMDDGMSSQNEQVMQWAKSRGLAHLDLQPLMGDKPDIYEDNIHLKLEGEKQKAHLISEYIKRNKLLTGQKSPPN